MTQGFRAVVATALAPLVLAQCAPACAPTALPSKPPATTTTTLAPPPALIGFAFNLSFPLRPICDDPSYDELQIVVEWVNGVAEARGYDTVVGYELEYDRRGSAPDGPEVTWTFPGDPQYSGYQVPGRLGWHISMGGEGFTDGVESGVPAFVEVQATLHFYDRDTGLEHVETGRTVLIIPHCEPWLDPYAPQNI